MTDFSFQLYSARNFPPLAYIFELLSRLGYQSVEGFGGLYDKADELKELLAKNNLTMPTGHFGLDQLQDKATAVKTARTLGVETLFCPAIPRPQWEQGEDAWKALAEELAALGEFYKAEGFGFGWHNHHFEFWPTSSGKRPMDILLEGAPDIGWEMDVAWVVRGENDPRAWMDKYGDRIIAVHVKDIAPEGEAKDEDGWADVGQGTMGWATLLPLIREKTAAKHFVMEHDNPSDLERFASRSIAAAKTY
ncbi:sugar phosphate isomerase/epimerase family protein [Pelagibacterium xiamenense]|uniref:sugar phosphate isomerase/epimerase family protein n=1 Tax=Pelagibacterium xiamenense TaxID=2901140 RepID=UPI001E472524|nr:sugar phosphate isomerase/epimerase [Pelagibacterium xiamenense]MCD7060870.1 sugar phosphate isomerase/epimerase [Pelagibacterium xiamenense]